MFQLQSVVTEILNGSMQRDVAVARVTASANGWMDSCFGREKTRDTM